MTMIAYRDGVMAADRATWAGRCVVGRRDKIIRFRHGLFAAAGDTGGILLLAQWLSSGWNGATVAIKPPVDIKEVCGLVIRNDGIVFHVDNGGGGSMFPAAPAPFWAEGGCSEFCIGAMAQGATAVQAVTLAVKYTDYGGNDPNEVQIERLVPAGGPAPRVIRAPMVDTAGAAYCERNEGIIVSTIAPGWVPSDSLGSVP